jgi:hypothetical protein
MFFLIYAMSFRRAPSSSFSDSALDFTMYVPMIRLGSHTDDGLVGN